MVTARSGRATAAATKPYPSIKKILVRQSTKKPRLPAKKHSSLRVDHAVAPPSGAIAKLPVETFSEIVTSFLSLGQPLSSPPQPSQPVPSGDDVQRVLAMLATPAIQVGRQLHHKKYEARGCRHPAVAPRPFPRTAHDVGSCVGHRKRPHPHSTICRHRYDIDMFAPPMILASLGSGQTFHPPGGEGIFALLAAQDPHLATKKCNYLPYGSLQRPWYGASQTPLEVAVTYSKYLLPSAEPCILALIRAGALEPCRLRSSGNLAQSCRELPSHLLTAQLKGRTDAGSLSNAGTQRWSTMEERPTTSLWRVGTRALAMLFP